MIAEKHIRGLIKIHTDEIIPTEFREEFMDECSTKIYEEVLQDWTNKYMQTVVNKAQKFAMRKKWQRKN